MEAERLAASDRTLVPESVRRPPAPGRPRRLRRDGAVAGRELADAALLFARAHHYTLVDRPRVTCWRDATVQRCRHPGRTPDSPTRSRRPERTPRSPTTEATTVGAPTRSTRWSTRCPRPSRRRPAFACTSRRGRVREVSIGAGLTIGRATDNDLVLADERVSRHHGRHRRPSRDARLRRSRQHERHAGQRRAGHRGGPGAPATRSGSARRRSRSRSDGGPDLMDGSCSSCGSSGPLPRAPVLLPVPRRRGRCCATCGRRRGSRRRARPARRGRLAERRAGGRARSSRSTRSRRSVAT